MFRGRLATFPEMGSLAQEECQCPKSNSRHTMSAFSGKTANNSQGLKRVRKRIKKFFSEGDYHGNVLCETDSVSSANEDVFPLNLQRTTPSTETSHDNRKCRPPDGSLKSDAQNSLINKSFLQKKITPSIRRNRNMKPTVAGKENRPYHDVT